MKAYFIGLFLMACSTCIAQNTDTGDLLEFIQQDKEDDQDFQQLFDQLEQLKQHPIHLNTADKEKLNDLILLDQLQIQNLISYRQKYGSFTDWQELLRVDGFDFGTIEKIKPYCSIAEKPAGKLSLKKYSDGRFEQTVRFAKTLKTAKGYIPADGSTFPKYTGDPIKFYTRTRYTLPNRLSFGIVGEKDPGEQWLNSKHPYTTDHFSAHLLVTPNNGRVTKLVIGDFTFSSGLGLVYNPAFGMFKSAQITQVYHPLSGLRPYSSVNEGNFFRGVSATFRLSNHLKTTVLLSTNMVDATISDNGEISSTYNTGLHRTTSELKRRKAARQSVAGADISYIKGRTQLGFNVLSQKLIPGTKNDLNAGINLHQQFSKGMVFGELAVNQIGAIGFISGALVSISKPLGSIVIYRNYSPSYTSTFGGTFSNSGKLQNERGVFTGLEFQINNRNKVSGYLDQYHYPEASFYTKFPSWQRDGIMQWNYTVKRKFMLYTRFRWQLQQRDSITENYETSYLRLKQNFRINAEWIIRKVLTLKQRFEITSTSIGTKGWLAYQDILYKPIQKGPDLCGRLAFFNCSTYDDRIYAYENDVLYSYTIPAYFNKGYRYYLMIHGKMTRNIDYWIRYSNWVYQNKEHVGSGLDEIEGNKKPQLEIQLRLVIK